MKGQARRAWACAGGIAPLLLQAACGNGRVLPTSPPVVEVGMEEYRFVVPSNVPSGRVVFQLTNAGSLDHDLTMVSLPDDFALTIDQQLRSDDRAGFQTRARVPPLKPRGTGTFAMDLAPGRYGVVCFVADADGENHGRKGMSAEFRVR